VVVASLADPPARRPGAITKLGRVADPTVRADAPVVDDHVGTAGEEAFDT
jgi:hypothetical protein